jgi:hypothetical protein
MTAGEFDTCSGLSLFRQYFFCRIDNHIYSMASIVSSALHGWCLSDRYALISCASFYDVYLFDAAEIELFCVILLTANHRHLISVADFFYKRQLWLMAIISAEIFCAWEILIYTNNFFISGGVYRCFPSKGNWLSKKRHPIIVLTLS